MNGLVGMEVILIDAQSAKRGDVLRSQPAQSPLVLTADTWTTDTNDPLGVVYRTTPDHPGGRGATSNLIADKFAPVVLGSPRFGGDSALAAEATHTPGGDQKSVAKRPLPRLPDAGLLDHPRPFFGGFRG